MARRAAFALVVLLTGAARAEPPFMDWVDAAPERRAEVVAFERYLERARVDGVLTTDLLLRNASSWKSCGLGFPYSMPPRTLWPHVVTTIKFIRDEIVPAIGPVTVESGYREPLLNRCAHGAPKSAHALYYALDLIPERAIARRDLIATICKLHVRKGKAYNVGLGFYDGVRFHIDTKSYRRWGSDNHGKTSPCAGVTG
jgi:hypothetical protein